MSIQKYEAFLKVVETGSITQASVQLGYTQSAISRMISDLEEKWGLRLLTRNHSGAELTGEGHLLLPHIQEIVKNHENLSFAISELHGLTSGMIRVGAFTSIATAWLPQVLKSFHEEYPNISFQMISGEQAEILDWLRRGIIDCGVLSLPVPPGFHATYLLRDSLVAVLPREHALADAAVYPLSRLSEEKFINLKEEHDHELVQFFDSLRQRPNICYEASNDFSVLAMVESGLGISVVHDLILHQNRYDVVKKPFDEPREQDIGIVVNAEAPSSTLVRKFVEHAVQYAAGE